MWWLQDRESRDKRRDNTMNEKASTSGCLSLQAVLAVKEGKEKKYDPMSPMAAAVMRCLFSNLRFLF